MSKGIILTKNADFSRIKGVLVFIFWDYNKDFTRAFHFQSFSVFAGLMAFWYTQKKQTEKKNIHTTCCSNNLDNLWMLMSG